MASPGVRVDRQHHLGLAGWQDARWLSPAKPVKVFPETRSPPVNINEHSSRKRAEKGLQYLRSYFPDADFPGDLVGDILETESRETRQLEAFDPLLGNLLEIMPSHQTQNEHTVVFPMGEIGRELNISCISSENMVFVPTGLPSFTFETPILQISSAVKPSQWIPTPSSTLLIRTHTSSSLLRVDCSKVTRELDITRSETGGVPIADSKILAFGPDIVLVNRSGKMYKCNTHHGAKAMQSIKTSEMSDSEHFWQLGVTGRDDECFLASCNSVMHIDMRSASSTGYFFLVENPNTIVTSFESPTNDYISRITTTSDVIWLDDRFRRRPLLSFKHYRNFDRTLRVLTASLRGGSLSLLASRKNGLVTLYDVSGGTDNLLHCNSTPSCLSHAGPVSTSYDGYALVTFPQDERLTFLRLCQRGSIYRQDIFVTRPGEDKPGAVHEGSITHRWDEDVLSLEKRANELQPDFGPAERKHFIEANLNGAYEEMFAFKSDSGKDVDRNVFKDRLARLSDVWQAVRKTTEHMLTTADVISGVEGGDQHPRAGSLAGNNNIDLQEVFGTVMHGHPAIHKLASLAQWHYNIQDTSIPTYKHYPADCASLDKHLRELDLVSKVEQRDSAIQREKEAREQLVVDLGLSKGVYSPQPIANPRTLGAGDGRSSKQMSYSEEPPEVTFGYFRPVRKIGGDHYSEKDIGFSSPLGVRLLLADWELGTDPEDYKYHDPYGVEDIDAQHLPEYRKLAAVPPMAQKQQAAPQRPPLVVAAATQPPVVQAIGRTTFADQRDGVWSQQSEGFLDEPATSTQVLPGRFGGRRKVGKKRVGGF